MVRSRILNSEMPELKARKRLAKNLSADRLVHLCICITVSKHVCAVVPNHLIQKFSKLPQMYSLESSSRS